MKRPKSRGVVPVGGYCRYTDPDVGFKVAHPYLDVCKSKARAERLKRGLPIPWNWDAFFDEQFCKATPQACVDVPDAPTETGPSWLKLAAQFASSMARWILAGMPIVTWEQYKERHTKCTGDENVLRCPHFKQFSTFGLSKCGACGCSGAKLYLATEQCPKGYWKALK